MAKGLSNFYAEWRVQSGIAPVFREDLESPPEYLLQAVWQHQRLVRDKLTTLDGQPVRILHPGFRSVEGGPDFRAAVVQFGDDAARTGDVEIDLRASGWRAHGHDRNPAFRNVMLHVTWETEPRAVAGGPPVMTLNRSLDAPLGELSLWLGTEGADDLPEEWRGRCCTHLKALSETQLTELLHQAALVRLRSKASQFQARARQAGWEQALWEGLFRALGYKHNVWPMQRLAELRPRWLNQSQTGSAQGNRNQTEPSNLKEEAVHATEVFAIQARLLGISGLLPVELSRSRTGSDDYLRRVWDLWWREREEFSDCALPRSIWRLHGQRPANHPQRRLALASHWSIMADLPSKLEKWCSADISERHWSGTLLEALRVEPDDFWSWHCTFRSARLKHPQPLLGPGRVTDLAVNVVLPWLWIRAEEGKNAAVKERIERRYFAWPAAEDNSVLRLARQRLLSGASARSLADAAAQQGLMQIVRDFCEHTNALCENCRLPDLAKEFVSCAD
jgi:hypothetical protein